MIVAWCGGLLYGAEIAERWYYQLPGIKVMETALAGPAHRARQRGSVRRWPAPVPTAAERGRRVATLIHLLVTCEPGNYRRKEYYRAQPWREL